MHKEMFDEIKSWFETSNHALGEKIADLGAFNINGAVKDIIPKCVGFDICEGRGVDVVFTPGIIPKGHVGVYDLVFCVNALNASPNISEFVSETSDLLKTNGILFLGYRISNEIKHSVSPNSYKYTWRAITNEESIKIISEFMKKFDIMSQKRLHIQSNVEDEIVILRKK